eukprot:3509582-Prymnesium_polylepis.1
MRILPGVEQWGSTNGRQHQRSEGGDSERAEAAGEAAGRGRVWVSAWRTANDSFRGIASDGTERNAGLPAAHACALRCGTGRRRGARGCAGRVCRPSPREGVDAVCNMVVLQHAGTPYAARPRADVSPRPAVRAGPGAAWVHIGGGRTARVVARRAVDGWRVAAELLEPLHAQQPLPQHTAGRRGRKRKGEPRSRGVSASRKKRRLRWAGAAARRAPECAYGHAARAHARSLGRQAHRRRGLV